MKQLVKNYTFWINEKERRMFQVIDTPFNQADHVVILEIKYYRPDDERKFEKIPYSDWVTLTEEKSTLKECIPSNITYTLIRK